jgi:hypothetical protein
MKKKRNYSSFDHVVANLISTFYYGAENCAQSPGYKYKKFSTFKELDEAFRQWFGEDWRKQEWAIFWLRNHNLFETKEYKREEIHKQGKGFRQKVSGSRRYNRNKFGPKQLTKRTPPETLAAFIKELQSQGIIGTEKLAAAIKEHFNISISHMTVSNLRRKYNL